MQFAALGDLHRDVLAQDILDPLGERLADLTAIGQHTFALCPDELGNVQMPAGHPCDSVTSAVVTATACGSPCVSTAMCRLIPDTFLPAS